MVAKCSGCNAVFDFSEQLSPAERAEPAAAATLTQRPLPVALPTGWKIQRRDGEPLDGGFSYRASPHHAVQELSLSWRWFSPGKHLFMLIFAVGWNSFLVFWYQAVSQGGAPWLFYVFPLVHVAVGVSMAYGALTGLVNRTTITVGDRELTVRHGPLPWRGNHTIAHRDVAQLFCQKHMTKNKSAHTFAVHAQLQDRELELVSNLPEARQALYIEQLIEGALGIEDAPVAGELKKTAG